MGPKAELAIVLDRSRDCFIPGDRVGGRVFLTNGDPLDISEIGIEFQGVEFLRYNSQHNENIILNQAQTLLTGPQTLQADKHAYSFEFMFPFPPLTNPTKVQRKGIRADENHTLPPSMVHNRPGVKYSFDVVIKYELRAWVKKPRRLVGGDKVAVECREELTFWPTDRHSDGLQTSFHGHTHEMQVVCDPPPPYPTDTVKRKEGITFEEYEVKEDEHEHRGRLSKLFPHMHRKRDYSRSKENLQLPTEKVVINMQFPTFFNRKSHNPVSFHASYPSNKGIPEVKLCGLKVKVKSTVRVPCMETTVYGSIPGISEEKYVLRTLSEDEDDPLKIPDEEGVPPLQINLFDDPEQQFKSVNFDFKTFNVQRTHNMSVKCRFRCGEQVFEFKKKHLPLTIPLPSSRPEPEKKAVT